MKISIIIPTINRYEDLKNTIQDLQHQNIQDFEIIVIDQTDRERFEYLAGLDQRIVHVWSENKSASAARNKGILLAKGEVLLFLDDDVIIENRNFLNNHLIPYLNGKTYAVYGSVLEKRVGQIPQNNRHKLSYNKNWGWLFFPQNYDIESLVYSARSCNFSVLKNKAIEIRGMDENYKKGAHREEADFCHRLTTMYGPFLFSPKARLVHIGNATGGIRSWDIEERKVPAQQHFDGAFYFLFKNISLKYYFPHCLSIFIFFYNKKHLLFSPKLLFITVKRTFIGIYNAILLVNKGPKYIEI